MPIDDLCNYIENKANQNDPTLTNNGRTGIHGPVGASGGIYGSNKIKKRG
jgi:hypothetical protein